MKTYLYNNNQITIQELDELPYLPPPPISGYQQPTIEETIAAYRERQEKADMEREVQKAGDRIRAWEAKSHVRFVNKFNALAQRQQGEVSDPFVWYDHHWDAHLLSDMPTAYIFYALRMVWNHSVPGWLRVGDKLRYYSDVPEWHVDYRRLALAALTTEFTKRIPYESDIRNQFVQIVERSELILRRGL